MNSTHFTIGLEGKTRTLIKDHILKSKYHICIKANKRIESVYREAKELVSTYELRLINYFRKINSYVSDEREWDEIDGQLGLVPVMLPMWEFEEERSSKGTLDNNESKGEYSDGYTLQ